jgi:hypothetical protein
MMICGFGRGRWETKAGKERVKTMNTIRKALLATAFAATVAGALTGASLRGETKEVDLAATCASAEWPMIPAACLNGGSDNVRYVTADNRIDARAMEQRFAVAFQ